MSKIDNENVENIISNADSNGKEERNVPDLRFKEDEQWTAKKMNEIASFYKGNGLSKEDISSEGNHCILYGQLYTTYTSEIIDNVVSKTKKIPINAFYSLSNDIIIPASGETPEDIAKACCITSDGILIGGDLNVIRAYKHNGGFLSYQLNGKRKCEIARLAQGKSIVHLHNSDIKNIKISYPLNKDIEIKICNFLFGVDKRIKTQKKIIEELTKLKFSINSQIFKENGNQFIIKDICKLGRGRVISNEEIKKQINPSYPVYSSQTQNNGIMGYLDNFEFEGEYITWTTDGANAGTIFYHNEKFNCTNVCGTLKIINENISTKYLSLVLPYSVKKYVSKNLANPKLMNNTMANVKVTIIPLEKQLEFVNTVIRIENKLNNEKSILKLYSKQKEYLLNKLFI